MLKLTNERLAGVDSELSSLNTKDACITMDENTGLTGWVLAGIGTVVSTLCGIVAYFYRTQISDYRANESGMKAVIAALTIRADKCEDDREELRIKYAVLEQRVSDLEINKKNRDSIG